MSLIPYLTNEEGFPPAEQADEEGIVAMGGDTHPQRLIAAYSNGIFPWPHAGFPLLWFSPNPRFVLLPPQLHLPRSLRKKMRHCPYQVRSDTAFESVMRACAQSCRNGQNGTWITPELITNYTALHRMGLAHSIETYEGDVLIGGLYGISLGGAFFGESMFTLAPDASKIAFATLMHQLITWKMDFVDCQCETKHLARFGAQAIPQSQFLALLKTSLQKPDRLGPWALSSTPQTAAF